MSDTTTRDNEIIADFEDGRSLRAIAADHSITYEAVRLILLRRLGDDGHRKAKSARQALLHERKRQARDVRVSRLVEILTSLFEEGESISLSELTNLYATGEDDTTVEDCRLAYSEFQNSLSRVDASRASLMALSERLDSADPNLSDDEILWHLKQAYEDVVLEDGSRFTVQNYEAWRRGVEGAPSAQTVTYRLTDDGKWSTAASLVDDTALARAGGGSARMWDDDDLNEAIDRFIAWAERTRSPLTRPSYVRYTQTLKSPMPSLSLIRVRFGPWSHLILSKTQ